jgi:two-component system sensor histidine kinase ChvG
VPIQRARSVQGVLLLSTLPGDVDEQLANERNMILMLALLSVIATLAAATMLARMVAGPIRRLSDAAVKVSLNRAGPADIPDFSSRGDEVGQLSRSLSQMTSTLYRRIEASEKFAADVAHELKNPLTAARAMAESLGYARTEEQRQQLVGQIQHELKRLNRLITDVSNASRLDAELARQQLEPVDIAAVATGVVSTFRDILSGDGRQVVLDVQEPSIMVRGHDGRLGQVLTNLIDNAISFSPEAGTVSVRIARRADGVEIVIDDEGPGIPPDKLDKVFERFYTDRPQTEAQRGKNSGLGLSICRDIIDAHNGRIWAENRYAGDAKGSAVGARFVVKLPPVSANPARRG